MFVEVPGIYEDLEMMRSRRFVGLEDDSTAVSASDRCASLIKHLEHWRRIWDDENPKACFEIVPDTRTSVTVDHEGPIFPTLLYYSGLSTANALTMYNSILILVLQLHHAFLSYQSGTLKDHWDTRDPLQPNEVWPTPLLANEICRSVEYHLQPPHAGAGAFYILFPLRIAFYTLPKASREGRWLANIIQRIANNGGLEIGRNILDGIPVRGETGQTFDSSIGMSRMKSKSSTCSLKAEVLPEWKYRRRRELNLEHHRGRLNNLMIITYSGGLHHLMQIIQPGGFLHLKSTTQSVGGCKFKVHNYCPNVIRGDASRSNFPLEFSNCRLPAKEILEPDLASSFFRVCHVLVPFSPYGHQPASAITHHISLPDLHQFFDIASGLSAPSAPGMSSF